MRKWWILTPGVTAASSRSSMLVQCLLHFLGNWDAALKDRKHTLFTLLALYLVNAQAKFMLLISLSNRC